MWTPDDFPGADHVPWQLLIRARYVFELDAVIASRVVRALAEVLPATAAAELSRAATRALTAVPRTPVKAATTTRALTAFADFDDWCGTKWPRWPWPWPGPRWFDPRELITDGRLTVEFADPIAIATLGRARAFVDAAGSPEFSKEFGAALDQAAGSFAN